MEKILIIDNHSFVRLGISLVIKDILPEAVVEEASSMDAIAAKLYKDIFDLLIVNIRIPGGKGLRMIHLINYSTSHSYPDFIVLQ